MSKQQLNCPVIITAYSKFVGKVHHKDKYSSMKYLAILLDEGHDIKNELSQRYKAVAALQREKSIIITGNVSKELEKWEGRGIREYKSYKLLGTPVNNNSDEFRTLLRWYGAGSYNAIVIIVHRMGLASHGGMDFKSISVRRLKSQVRMILPSIVSF